MVMLRENLIVALSVAIEAQRRHDRAQPGYNRDLGDTCIVAGWVQVREALERGEDVELRTADEHCARLAREEW